MTTTRLTVGSLAPNAQLMSPQQQSYELATLWAQGGLILSFLRHFG